jgi:hypothetical protein
MKAVSPSETLAYHTTWCHIPANDNTKLRIVFILSHLGAEINNKVCSNPVTEGAGHIC